MAADRRRPAGGRCWSTSGSTSRGGKSARRGWCPTGYRLGPGLGFGKIDLSGLNWERRRCRRWAACGQSKLVDLIFAYELTRRLEARGSVVRSLAAHPSCSRTPRASRTGSCRSVPSSRGRALRWARCPTLRAVTSPDAPSGSFGGPGGFGQFRRLPRRVDSTAATKDPATAGAVWDFATELTGRVRLIETRRAATCPAALERQPRKPRDRRSPRGWRRNDRVSNRRCCRAVSGSTVTVTTVWRVLQDRVAAVVHRSSPWWGVAVAAVALGVIEVVCAYLGVRGPAVTLVRTYSREEPAAPAFYCALALALVLAPWRLRWPTLGAAIVVDLGFALERLLVHGRVTSFGNGALVALTVLTAYSVVRVRAPLRYDAVRGLACAWSFVAATTVGKRLAAGHRAG